MTDRELLEWVLGEVAGRAGVIRVADRVRAHLLQRPLFPPEPDEVAPAVANNADRENLRAKAVAWMAENPEVYATIERAALALAAERARFGIGHIAERVRWDHSFKWKGTFKINNNYRAYIARRLLAEHPELQGKLSFRETRY